MDDSTHTRPAFALASDLEALRAEVRELRALVHSSHSSHSSHHPNGAPSSAGHSPYAGMPHHHKPGSAPFTPEQRPPYASRRSKAGIEVSVSSLEDTIVGPGPGSRPTKVVHQRAPAPWDTAARSKMLIDTALSMLPPPATCAALIDEFFRGPLHQCWYVMDERTFRARHAAFEAGEIDASWLALYLIVSQRHLSQGGGDWIDQC